MPFKPGEVLSYDIAWSNFVTAGTATVTLRDKRPSFGSVAYYAVAEGRPTSLVGAFYRLYYKADTLIDVYTLLPQRGSLYSESGRRRRMKETRFDHAAGKARFEVTGGTVVQKELAVPANTQDLLSVVYFLRTVRLETGATVTVPVSDNGRLYRVRVTVAARENVMTPLGQFTAWRVEPAVLDERTEDDPKSLSLWISEDARRLPLRIQADLPVGTFNVVLREVSG